MKPLPIVYVSDMHRSLTFYRSLGESVTIKSEGPAWSELDMAGGALALHRADPLPVPIGGRVALTFATRGPLEPLLERLSEQGLLPGRAIADEAFGCSVVVADPDGLLIQINEHDPKLY